MGLATWQHLLPCNIALSGRGKNLDTINLDTIEVIAKLNKRVVFLTK
jgi:hypothetical protein